MALRLVQYKTKDGARAVAALDAQARGRVVNGVATTYDLARQAIAAGVSLEAKLADLGVGDHVDIRAALADGRVLAPLDHPTDSAHTIVTGTGLTHLGSAEGRDAMHKKLQRRRCAHRPMRMFKLGLEKGKPNAGEEGAQPEWSKVPPNENQSGTGAPFFFLGHPVATHVFIIVVPTCNVGFFGFFTEQLSVFTGSNQRCAGNQ